MLGFSSSYGNLEVNKKKKNPPVDSGINCKWTCI